MTNNFVPAVGAARRSQGIFTFGIGAIVDFTKGSFMPLGLKLMEWQWSRLTSAQRDEITFHEPRLQRLLGVKEFRTYPAAGERQLSDYGKQVRKPFSVPCVRFPEWLECPKCHRLGREGDPFELQPDGGVICPGKCKVEVNPVRFVVACPKHHIDDFPWVWWAHSNKKEECKQPVLYLRSRGQSVALGDLYVECQCKEKRSLGEIFRPSALRDLSCSGRSPWLQLDENCTAKPLTALQRGASNVHFSVTASMLSIPPASEAMSKLFDRDWPLIKSIVQGVPEQFLEPALSNYLRDKPVDPKVAIDWILRRMKVDSDAEGESEESCRYQEYKSLSTECRAEHGQQPEFENAPFHLEGGLDEWFDLASSVRRLREVRAYCGFTRIEDIAVNIEDIPQLIREKKIARLAGQWMDWFPAVEVRGEGIFLRFSEKRIQRWLDGNQKVIQRAKEIDNLFRKHSESRGLEVPYAITPRLLLVHGFAHALLRRLSLDCGYSSASLRERLYVSEGDQDVPAMAGFLVYTASPDSDGSLGGLVNLATRERLGVILGRTIEDLRWCGSDPVCIETEPNIQGDRFSGASCHGCLLVPETACERFNRELDRAMLVGCSPEADLGDFKGFFEDFQVES
jgi:hypothetical protein